MNSKNDLVRVSLDLPKEIHKRLKARALIEGKSMREVLIEAIEATNDNRHCLQELDKLTKKNT